MSCGRWFNVALVISASCCVELSLLCLWRWRLLRSEWDAQHTRSDPSSPQHGEECCATEETRGVDFTFNECMRNIQKWHLKHPRPYLCIFNQRPPDGARERSFHDLHTVVEMKDDFMVIYECWPVLLVGKWAEWFLSPSNIKQASAVRWNTWREECFLVFFLRRERYRPSWIYVPVYVNLCLLKTSSASTGSSTITAQCDPNYVIYKLPDEPQLFVRTGENSEKLSRKGSWTSVTAKVTKRRSHPYCSFAFERHSVKTTAPHWNTVVYWGYQFYLILFMCLPPDDQAITLKQPDKVCAALKMLRKFFKTFKRVYLLWDGGERCVLKHLTNVQHQHIWSVAMLGQKLHIKE